LAIFLGKTARHLRETLGLTQRATANALGISYVHLCNIENNKALPSQELLERFRTLWGIDLYVLAWCLYGDHSKLPAAMRRAAALLAKSWQNQLGRQEPRRRRAAGA